MVVWTRVGWMLGIAGMTACAGNLENLSGAGGGAPDESATSTGSDTTDGTTTSTSGGGTTTSTSGGGSDKCTAASVNMDDPCEVCVVTSCTAESVACCEQEGCLDIIACAQKTGCTGVDCYTPETCQDVIDAAGGVAVAVNYAAPLGECALQNCANECGGN